LASNSGDAIRAPPDHGADALDGGGGKEFFGLNDDHVAGLEADDGGLDRFVAIREFHDFRPPSA